MWSQREMIMSLLKFCYLISLSCKFLKIWDRLLPNFIMKIFPRNKFRYSIFHYFVVHISNICPNNILHQLSTIYAYDKINGCCAPSLVLVGGVIGLLWVLHLSWGTGGRGGTIFPWHSHKPIKHGWTYQGPSLQTVYILASQKGDMSRVQQCNQKLSPRHRLHMKLTSLHN